MEISVIVPVFNEEETISKVIDSLIANVKELHEIIIVDDGSVDSTGRICHDYQERNSIIQYYPLEENKGKTYALKEGIRFSTGDVVIIQDADLEYDPSEINEIMEPFRKGVADVVLGSRFLVRKASRSLYFRHYLANQLITFISNVCTDLNLTDVETCYKAFRGDIIRNMIITSNRFGFEIEAIAKIAKLKCRVFEVPISYYGRSYEEGKKIYAKDGIMAIYYLIKYNIFTSKKSSFRNL